MRYLILLTGLVALIAAPAAAQGRINWQRNPQQAVAAAQRQKLPLMFYVLSGSRDRDDDLERDHKRSFSHPKVLEWARRFVPVRLSRSVHRDLLPELGLRESANMEIAFVAPDGTKLGTLGPSGIAQPDSLVQKMELVFDAYRQGVFQKDVQPVLQNPQAKPDELMEAIKIVRYFNIKGADDVLVSLLGRKDLNDRLRTEVYETLAQLSTDAAVDKLLELSAGGDAAASKALEDASPLAAERMVEKLVTKDGYVRLDIYNAVVKICNVPERKSERWWERVAEPLLLKEIERVKQRVKKCAELWKEQHAE